MSAGRRSRKGEAAKELRFEDAMEKLEAIVRDLEGSEIPLEKALEMFEEGVRLSKICHRKLSEAEKKVQVLMRGESGEMETRPFETEEDEEEGKGEEEHDDPGGKGEASLF